MNNILFVNCSIAKFNFYVLS